MATLCPALFINATNNPMSTFSGLFVLTLFAGLSTQIWLHLRQSRSVLQHRHTVPTEFSAQLSLPAHQKAADYTREKNQLTMLIILFDSILLLGWTLGGGLQWLDHIWRSMAHTPVTTGTGFIISLMVINALINLPFSIYSTFSIEQKYGFNHMTVSLFFQDLLKQSLLSIIIGIPLLMIILVLMSYTGSLWWLAVWLVWMSFTLLINWAWPRWIAPLFNTFTPLEDGDIKTRIQQLMSRCGFHSQGILVMDGSKRSSHGNAYFTGFGQQKRIVFYDTLLKHLTPPEIEAVLAHELGHFYHKHIRNRIILMMGISFLALALLGWLSEQNFFYQDLGIQQSSDYAALILFIMVLPVFTFFLQPIFSVLSRSNEFEADRFASKQTASQDLIQALVKLYRENASTLTPDPLYSAFYDSHPPASIRIAQLQKTPPQS